MKVLRLLPLFVGTYPIKKRPDLAFNWPDDDGPNSPTTCRCYHDLLHRFGFETHDGHFLRAEGGGGGDVTAISAHQGPWETFYVIDLDRGYLEDGDIVQIKSFKKQFLKHTDSGGLKATKTDPPDDPDPSLPKGQFVIKEIGSGNGSIGRGDTIALEAATGHVVAEGGGGGDVNANRSDIGIWEKFTVTEPSRRNVVQLKSHQWNTSVFEDHPDMRHDITPPTGSDFLWANDYNGGVIEHGDVLSFEPYQSAYEFVGNCYRGTGVLRSNFNQMAPCAQIQILKVSGTGPIEQDDLVFLRMTNNSRYVTAYNDGTVRNYQTNPGAWEKFRFRYAQNVNGTLRWTEGH